MSGGRLQGFSGGCDPVVAGYKGFPMLWSRLFSFDLIARKVIATYKEIPATFLFPRDTLEIFRALSLC